MNLTFQPSRSETKTAKRAAFSLTVPFCCALACGPQVARVSDSSVVNGRPIAPEAYATFLQGRLLELEGRNSEAQAKYVATTKLDSRAHEAHTRLGSLLCERNPAEAAKAFDRALALAPESVALWQARATCSLLTQEPANAEKAASMAFRFAPDDPRSGHLLVLAQLQNRHISDARTSAWAHVSRFPRDTVGWWLVASQFDGPLRLAVLSEAAVRTSSKDAQHLTQLDPQVERLLMTLHSPSVKSLLPQAHAECALTDALYRQDHAAAVHAARPLSLSSVRLAISALSRGAYQEAFVEARRAATIAPANVEAWTLALSMADLLGKEDDFILLLENPPELTGPIPTHITLRLNEVLARRVP